MNATARQNLTGIERRILRIAADPRSTKGVATTASIMHSLFGPGVQTDRGAYERRHSTVARAVRRLLTRGLVAKADGWSWGAIRITDAGLALVEGGPR